MELQQNQPMSTFNQNERQNTNQFFRFWQHLQTNFNIEQGEKHNEQTSDFSERTLCAGNLSHVVAEADLFKLFGIREVVTSKKQVKLIYLCASKRVILG